MYILKDRIILLKPFFKRIMRFTIYIENTILEFKIYLKK